MEYIQIHKKDMMMSSGAGEEKVTPGTAARASDANPNMTGAQDEEDDDDELGDAFIISSSSFVTNGAASSIKGSAATLSGEYFI
jgi:hypothetical protein